MIKYAVIDTETIPNTTLPKGVKPEFDRNTVKVGNIKDGAKVKEKIAIAEHEFDMTLDKKMSLDPDLCEVVCFVGQQTEGKIEIYSSDVIELAWNFIQGCYLEHIPLISYNGIGFDLPVLWHSAMRHNIPVSPQMYADLTKRYENRYHYDLCELLATWDFGKKKTRSLDFYVRLFNIGEKTGEGSQVYDWWKNQDYDKIQEHCEVDVKLTAKLFERLETYIVREI